MIGTDSKLGSDYARNALALLLVFVLSLTVALGAAWNSTLMVLGVVALIGLIFLVWRGPFTVLMIWMAVSPFVQNESFMFRLPVGPLLSWDRVLLPLAVILTVFQILAKRRSATPWAVEDICLFAFILWGFLSISLWRPLNPLAQLTPLAQQFILPILAYWTIIQVVDSEEHISRITLLPLFILIVLALPAPLEELTGTTAWGTSSELVAGVFRVRTFTQSAWELGTVAGILLSISTFSISFPFGIRRRLLALVAILFGGVAILLAFMRASWLAAGSAIFLSVILNHRWRRWTPIIGVGVAVAILSGVTFLQGTDLWLDRLMNMTNIIGRDLIFEQQLELFFRDPLLGQGLSTSFTQFFSLTNEFAGAYYTISHNTYMSVLVDFGLLGLSYYLAMIFILIKSVRTYRRLKFGFLVGRELVIALWAAVAVALIESFTFETRLFASINTLFWVALGLLRTVDEISKRGVNA